MPLAKNAKRTTWLIAYYGLLQSLHLLALIRAGVLLLSGQDAPFPILPPPGGWQPQAFAFLIGLGTTDIVGILLGLLFAFKALFRNKPSRTAGILSLSVFFTGALVFAAGTFPAGAWSAHPVAYWAMVVLFLPTVYLFITLLLQKERFGS
jgi:hypothetical protein